MKIITISGLDGSGKSTQIELLKAYLEGQGRKVFYFHAIEFGLANKLSGENKVGGSKSITRANWLQIFLRRIFLLIDLQRFRLLRKKLCNKNFDYILSDRYFYDTVVNIEYLCLQRDPKAKLSDFLKLRFRIEAPDGAIYLATDPEQIMARERKPDQGLEYLQKKKELYDTKAAAWAMQIVDGNREKTVIFEEIKNLAI
ncbi:MAG: hypothetical protein WC238_02310 [Parcubacteria group bacterium]|jgi:thymidylate kinase